uniref:Uncharacterized protein n=1 Tax=Stegastes partitus TaxID=144197 RepID=A0A3B5BJP8_9TELE
VFCCPLRSETVCYLVIVLNHMRYPQPRGQKKKRVVKYGMGGLIVLLLICIVWFPLLFMSLIKSVAGVVNRPLDVSLTITLGGFQPIFTMSAQQNQLRDLTEEDFSSFISSYSYTPDVTVAELQGSSNSLWTISPPSRQYLSQVLSLDHFPLTVSWTVQRSVSVVFCVVRVIQDVFPCFMRAPSDSNAKPIEQLYSGVFAVTCTRSERTTPSTNHSSLLQSDNRYKDILLDHGSVCVGGSGHREVRAAVCRPHPQTLHRHLPGEGDRDSDQMDATMMSQLWFLTCYSENVLQTFP